MSTSEWDWFFSNPQINGAAQSILKVCGIPLIKYEENVIDNSELSIIDQIHTQGFSIIYKALHKGKIIRVIVLAPEILEDRVALMMNISSLKYLSQSCFVEFRGLGYFNYQSSSSKVLVLTEHYETNLFDFMTKEQLEWKDKIELLRDLAYGLSILHQSSIFLQNFQSEYILISNSEKKIKIPPMFGVDIVEPLERAQENIFSFGIIILELITEGKFSIYKTNSNIFTQQDQMIALIDQMTTPNCPKILSQLAINCCHKNSLTRPTMIKCHQLLSDLLSGNLDDIDEISISSLSLAELPSMKGFSSSYQLFPILSPISSPALSSGRKEAKPSPFPIANDSKVLVQQIDYPDHEDEIIDENYFDEMDHRKFRSILAINQMDSNQSLAQEESGQNLITAIGLLQQVQILLSKEKVLLQNQQLIGHDNLDSDSSSVEQQFQEKIIILKSIFENLDQIESQTETIQHIILGNKTPNSVTDDDDIILQETSIDHESPQSEEKNQMSEQQAKDILVEDISETPIIIEEVFSLVEKHDQEVMTEICDLHKEISYSTPKPILLDKALMTEVVVVPYPGSTHYLPLHGNLTSKKKFEEIPAYHPNPSDEVPNISQHHENHQLINEFISLESKSAELMEIGELYTENNLIVESMNEPIQVYNSNPLRLQDQVSPLKPPVLHYSPQPKQHNDSHDVHATPRLRSISEMFLDNLNKLKDEYSSKGIMQSHQSPDQLHTLSPMSSSKVFRSKDDELTIFRVPSTIETSPSFERNKKSSPNKSQAQKLNQALDAFRHLVDKCSDTSAKAKSLVTTLDKDIESLTTPRPPIASPSYSLPKSQPRDKFANSQPITEKKEESISTRWKRLAASTNMLNQSIDSVPPSGSLNKSLNSSKSSSPLRLRVNTEITPILSTNRSTTPTSTVSSITRTSSGPISPSKRYMSPTKSSVTFVKQLAKRKETQPGIKTGVVTSIIDSFK